MWRTTLPPPHIHVGLALPPSCQEQPHRAAGARAVEADEPRPRRWHGARPLRNTCTLADANSH
eukprot:9336783-Pyramimonas_sp.AAC.1